MFYVYFCDDTIGVFYIIFLAVFICGIARISDCGYFFCGGFFLDYSVKVVFVIDFMGFCEEVRDGEWGWI